MRTAWRAESKGPSVHTSQCVRGDRPLASDPQGSVVGSTQFSLDPQPLDALWDVRQGCASFRPRVPPSARPRRPRPSTRASTCCVLHKTEGGPSGGLLSGGSPGCLTQWPLPGCEQVWAWGRTPPGAPWSGRGPTTVGFPWVTRKEPWPLRGAHHRRVGRPGQVSGLRSSAAGLTGLSDARWRRAWLCLRPCRLWAGAACGALQTNRRR